MPGLDYKEPKIEIDSIEFEKAGSITFVGTVENQEIVLTVDESCRDFEKFIPQVGFPIAAYKDSDGLCNAALDNFNSLHWLIKIDSGHIMSTKVYLTPIIEEMLLEAYHKTL